MPRWPFRSEKERFMSHVQVGPSQGECWLWMGGRTPKGYGCFYRTGDRQGMAHRAAYELLVGPIPDRLVIDHLCGNPTCVNPAHLEPVTNSENLRRGDLSRNNGAALRTACPQGHAYDEANTYRDKRGRRTCKTCRRAAGREYWRRQHAR
jgi:hypothetical protein